MAIRPGNKKENAVTAGRLIPMFRVVRNVGKANRIAGRLRRGNP